MSSQAITLKKNRRYRFKGDRARWLIETFEPLAQNAAFARFMGAGKLPTITIRTKDTTLDLSATWRYRFADGDAALRLHFADLPLP
ncbi:hypothetical protein [Ferrovibrio sp.]|uniref:hypothetical protein n=1 Tax=Ferrovibrio sp. TaxID=1917215 RepID=UPI0035AEB176